MFLKGNKGQSALEYLMTYGWALVVIVIVVAALVFLINPSQVGTEGCTGFTKLPIGNFQFDDAAGLQFKITNQTGRALSIVSFAGAFSNGGTTQYASDPSIVTVGANTEVTVTLDPGSLVAGPVTADLNVTYNDGDFTRSATGTCKGTITT
ncbi:MAG TPA: hypothetical protein VJG83_03425 [archaeon]|nr:hypothetical protein [archaeon]